MEVKEVGRGQETREERRIRRSGETLGEVDGLMEGWIKGVSWIYRRSISLCCPTMPDKTEKKRPPTPATQHEGGRLSVGSDIGYMKGRKQDGAKRQGGNKGYNSCERLRGTCASREGIVPTLVGQIGQRRGSSSRSSGNDKKRHVAWGKLHAAGPSN